MVNYESYDDCREDVMTRIMHEFKDGELKNRGNQIVKDRKQALAIGLNETNRLCHYNKNERKHFMEKVIKDLTNIKKRLIVTNFIETFNIIKVLIKNNKHSKAEKIYKMLIDKITFQELHKMQLNNNMWEIFRDITELFQ